MHLCMDQQHYWPSFCDAVGRPEWKSDPRLATHEARERNGEYCVQLVEALFAERCGDFVLRLPRVEQQSIRS